MPFSHSSCLVILALELSTIGVYADEEAAPATSDDDLFAMDIEQLRNIKVQTASKTSEDIDAAPATIYVVTERDIISNGYMSLVEALENIPGVVPINLGFFAFGGQRGLLGNFSQTLILINGREMQNLIAAETFISHQFATHNIKQIEVINGPGSVLYGANAFVGIINIITKNDSKEYDRVELQRDFGSQDTNAYSLILAKRFGHLRISGSVRVFETDNWDFSDFVADTERFSNGSNPVQQEQNTLRDKGYLNQSRAEPVSFKLEFGDFYIGTEAYYLVNGKGLENVAADYTSQRDTRRLRQTYWGWHGAIAENSRLIIENTRYKEWFWGRNYVYSDAAYAALLEERDRHGTPRDAPLSDDEIAQHFLHVYSQENSSGSSRERWDLQSHTQFSGENDIIFGLTFDRLDVLGIAISNHDLVPEFDETVSDDNAMRRPFYQSDKRSLYLQYRRPFFERRLNVTLGGRRDDHSLYGSVNTYRSGLVWQANEATQLKALFGQAFREPNIFEQGAHNPPDVPPNTDLKPARINTLELALMRKFGSQMTANVVAFRNDVTDFIVPLNTYNFTNSRQTNIVKGAEMQLLYKFGAWSGDVAYSYVDPGSTPVNNKAIDALNNYQNRLSLGVNYDFANVWRMNVRYNYFDAMQAEHGNPNVNEVIDIASANRVDVALSLHGWRYEGCEISLSAAVKNVFEEEYYQPNVRNGGPMQFLQPGRQYSARLIFSF